MSESKILLCALLLITFMVVPVYADDLSGRYLLNTNNYLGYLDISVRGSAVSGTMTWFLNSKGEAIDIRENIINGKVSREGENTLYLYFRREKNPQHYHGYFSYDKKLISGYFEKGYRVPWYAVRQ